MLQIIKNEIDNAEQVMEALQEKLPDADPMGLMGMASSILLSSAIRGLDCDSAQIAHALDSIARAVESK